MQETIEEDSRKIPVKDSVDVLIAGGGPAGVAAALASARAGASTCLIESQGCLGGTWTAGLVSWIIDYENKTGLMSEILDRLESLGGRAVFEGELTSAFDVEKMKLLLERMCCKSGVKVLLHHFVAGARVSRSQITHAIMESKSGRQAIAAKVFIDCTGDGDLASYAGCGFDLGRPQSGKTQPMSFNALVAGIDPVQTKPYFHHRGAYLLNAQGVIVKGGDPGTRLMAEMERGGVSPSYNGPSLFWIRDDLFMLQSNHEYGFLGINAQDLAEATIDGREEIHRLVDGLRNLGGIWEKIYVVATPSHIGVREGRRVHGRYLVTADDLINGVRHHDGVCRVNAGIDLHSTDKNKNKGIEEAPIHSKPYDIPLRALIAKDINGLMMAGRCISGDFLAHSSYRLTGNAVAMGEAAGYASAIAALSQRFPHEVQYKELKHQR